MSHANPFPRRRSRRAEGRRVPDRHAPRLSRDEFARRWSMLMIRSFPANPALEGKRLDEIARMQGKDPLDAAIDMLKLGGAPTVSFRPPYRFT